MLCAFDLTINHVAPEWSKVGYTVGLIGFPFNAVLAWPMATQSGYAFFVKPEVNAKMRVILDSWRDKVLKTGLSQYVLGETKAGWLQPEPLKVTAQDTNPDGREWPSFEELFECNKKRSHWRFASWDAVFVTKFKNIDTLRPVAKSTDNNWVVNSCESKSYAHQTNVKEQDSFWLKGQPYSVSEIMAHDGLEKDFIGDTVYQVFRSATSYHRWHSPVDGKIVKKWIINGTYFSEPIITGFTNPDSPDPAAPDQGQECITHLATRAIFLI